MHHSNKPIFQETESKLKETMHVLKMQRSRSDLDVRADVQSIGGGSLYGAGLMREVGQNSIGPVNLFFYHKNVIIFLAISLNMCFRCSKEPSH